MEIETKKRIGPKRILINVPEELHEQIKIRAARRNIPMRTWVIRAIGDAIKKEEQYE